MAEADRLLKAGLQHHLCSREPLWLQRVKPPLPAAALLRSTTCPSPRTLATGPGMLVVLMDTSYHGDKAGSASGSGSDTDLSGYLFQPPEGTRNE